MGNLTPAHYSKLIRRSGLPPTVRLVALTLAALRFDEQLTSKPHQPLEVTRERLAAECGLTTRAVGQALKALRDAGWLRSEAVYRDGRQRGSRYWLQDAELGPAKPSTTTTEGTTFPQYRGNELTLSRGNDVPTVLRSKNRVAADDAAHRGGGGSDGTGQTQTAVPRSDSPLGGDPPADETEALEQIAADHRDVAAGVPDTAGLAQAYDGLHPVNVDCPFCGAEKGRTCMRPSRGWRHHEPTGWHPARVAAAADASRPTLRIVGE